MNLRHATSRVWTCTAPEFKLSWMKLCSGDNHYTTERTTNDLPKVLRGMFLADLRTLLQRLLACLNFTLDSEDGSNTSSLKPLRWVRLDLIIAFTMGDIYINSNLKPLTKFNSCSRSTELKDILLWNISQMIMKSIPISTRIVISCAMKQGILIRVWQKNVNGNWAVSTWVVIPPSKPQSSNLLWPPPPPKKKPW